MAPRVAVVGAGIVGLSSAIALQQVTIVAEAFSPNLTSDVAAGFWWPYLVDTDDKERMKQIMNESFDYISSLVGVAGTGALWQSGHEINKEDMPEPDWSTIVKGFRHLSKGELAQFGDEYKSGWFFTTLGLEPTVYMRYITNLFLSRGGRIEQKKLGSLEELADSFDLIVNCCGLGALHLVGDKEVKPIRGQVLRVRAPSVKHFLCNGDSYCLLNSDWAVLGGTHDEGEWDTTVDHRVAEKILHDTQRLIPELKDAVVLSHHVGLRPYRPKLRLEEGRVRGRNGEVPVIHNYGHGGSGVTLFWGCALRVVAMARPLFPSSAL